MSGGSSRTRAFIAVVVVAVLAAACSSSSSSSSSAPTTATTAPPRTPKVAAASLEGPITTGELSPPADPRPLDLAAIGYTQEEYFASGTATTYTADGALSADGRWKVKAGATAPYKTRFVVRRPSDPKRFNGTVVVEWLNVTVVEAAPEWAYTNQAIVDAGAAWVGVSVQALGVVGGKSLLTVSDARAQVNGGLRGSNPTRYGTLAHPGDTYAFDIYSQIGAAVRTASFFGAKVHRVIAAGESQSAAFMTGYIDAVQPVANAYDGFFVHSRGSGAAHPDGALDMRGADVSFQFRTDLDAPILAFETETDVGPLLGYARSAQPDTSHLRVWEVAGTSHADAYLVNGNFSFCPAGINDGPQHYVTEAAMAALLHWVDKGVAPPHADRIQSDGTTVRRDVHGNALGGIRTPSVDVPTETLTGEAPAGAPVLCALFGGAKPFDAATLHALYPTKQAYLDAFDKALDRAISLGFVRAADRDAYVAEASAVKL